MNEGFRGEFSVNGRSAGMYDDPLAGMTRQPTMLMGRAGMGLGGFRAGVGGGMMDIPGLGRKSMPTQFDAGYSTPFAGGSLDFGAEGDANRRARAMIKYLREF